MIDKHDILNFGIVAQARTAFELFVEGLDMKPQAKRMEEAGILFRATILRIGREVGPVFRAWYYGHRQGSEEGKGICIWFYEHRSSDNLAVSSWFFDPYDMDDPSRDTVPDVAWSEPADQQGRLYADWLDFRPVLERAQEVLDRFLFSAEEVRGREDAAHRKSLAEEDL